MVREFKGIPIFNTKEYFMIHTSVALRTQATYDNAEIFWDPLKMS